MSKRISLYIIGTAAALGASYFIFVTLRSHAVVTVIILHCVFCPLSLLVVLSGARKTRADTPIIFRFGEKRNYLLETMAAASAFFGGLSTYVMMFISGLLIARSSTLINYFKVSASVGLSSYIAGPSIAAVIYLIFVYIIACYNFDLSRELFIITVSVLISVILRHLAYIISGSSVRTVMRRTGGNVYVLFSVVACCDLLSITLASNSLLNWHDNVFSVVALSEVSKGLIFGNLIDIVKYASDRTFPPTDVIIFALIGAIFNATIIDGLFKLKEFMRSDVDYISIGLRLTQIGRYSEAISIFSNVKHRTNEFFIYRAAAYIGLAKFDIAWEDASNTRYPTNEIVLYPPSDGEVGLRLLDSFGSVSFDDGVIFKFIRFCTNRDLDDCALAGIVEGICSPKIPIKNIEKLVPTEINDSRYQYCQTIFSILSGDIGHARQLLIKIRPNNNTEKLMYFRFALVIVLATFAGSSDPFESLSDLAFRYTSSLKITNCTFFEKVLTYSTALCFLVVGKKLHSNEQERWKYIVDQLRADPVIYENPGLINFARNVQ
jgi:hypothetical protein